MGKIDILYGLLLGAFSLLFFSATMKFPKSSGGIDPRVFPLVVIAATFALSVLLVVQGTFRIARGQDSSEKTLPRGEIAFKLVAFAVAGLLYAGVLERFGYILVTPFLMALGMYFFGERRPLRIVFVSVLVSGILYLGFRGVFRVPLPRSFFW